MFYQLAADAIVLMHFGFILYVVLGGLLLIYPAGLGRELQTAMGIALLVVNALVYLGLIIRDR